MPVRRRRMGAVSTAISCTESTNVLPWSYGTPHTSTQRAKHGQQTCEGRQHKNAESHSRTHSGLSSDSTTTFGTAAQKVESGLPTHYTMHITKRARACGPVTSFHPTLYSRHAKPKYRQWAPCGVCLYFKAAMRRGPVEPAIVDLQNPTVQTASGTQLHHRAPQNAAEEESGNDSAMTQPTTRPSSRWHAPTSRTRFSSCWPPQKANRDTVRNLQCLP